MCWKSRKPLTRKLWTFVTRISYAPRSVHMRRPPIEETMHEHWKKTANLAPVMKRDCFNYIAHVENNFSSLQRVNLLTEIPITSDKKTLLVLGFVEKSSFPFLFVNGVAGIDDCLHAFMKATNSISSFGKLIEKYVENHCNKPGIVMPVKVQQCYLGSELSAWKQRDTAWCRKFTEKLFWSCSKNTAMILWELFVFPGSSFLLRDMSRPNETLCFWLKWNAAQREAKMRRFMNMIDFYLLKAVVSFCN